MARIPAAVVGLAAVFLLPSAAALKVEMGDPSTRAGRAPVGEGEWLSLHVETEPSDACAGFVHFEIELAGIFANMTVDPPRGDAGLSVSAAWSPRLNLSFPATTPAFGEQEGVVRARASPCQGGTVVAEVRRTYVADYRPEVHARYLWVGQADDSGWAEHGIEIENAGNGQTNVVMGVANLPESVDEVVWPPAVRLDSPWQVPGTESDTEVVIVRVHLSQDVATSMIANFTATSTTAAQDLHAQTLPFEVFTIVRRHEAPAVSLGLVLFALTGAMMTRRRLRARP